MPSAPSSTPDTSGQASSQRTFLRASGVIGGLTLASRLAGFFREALIAKAFGTSQSGSALVVAQSVPNLSRSLISEDVAQGALVPPLGRLMLAGREFDAARVALWAGVLSTLLLALISLLMLVTASAIVAVSAPGEGRSFNDAATPLLRLLLPAVAINGLLAASSAYLVAHRRFFAVGLGALVSNIPVLVVLLVSSPSVEVVALWIGLGYVLQAAYLLISSGRQVRNSFRILPIPWSELRIIGSLAVPVMFSLGMANLSGVVDTAFSTLVGTGGPAALDKAFRLVLVPYGVFAMAIGIVALPNMVAAAMADPDEFSAEVVRATRLQAIVLVPLALAMGLFAHDIVRVAYQRGEFGPASTSLTSDALIGFAFALPALGLSMVGTRAWLSRQRPWVPARLAVLGLLANAALNAVLVGPLGIAAMGISTAVVHASVGTTLILTVTADRRRTARQLGSFVIRLVPSVVVGALIGLGVYLALRSLPAVPRDFLSVAFGTVGLVACASRIGLSDYSDIVTSLRKRG